MNKITFKHRLYESTETVDEVIERRKAELINHIIQAPTIIKHYPRDGVMTVEIILNDE